VPHRVRHFSTDSRREITDGYRAYYKMDAKIKKDPEDRALVDSARHEDIILHYFRSDEEADSACVVAQEFEKPR
jgi:hypothetical protein